MQDNYLKYLGWQLYDKYADVRLAASRSALQLYRNDQWVSNLNLCTTRFKPRMLQLTMDDSSDVSEAGIDLVSELLK
eukprot:SAG11_NODE_13532_length_651_cov_0.744565_1_plen_76_part_01